MYKRQDLNKDRTTALSKGLVDIIKKLLARKNKYSSYSEILIDLTKIMYVNADIVETKNTEYDEGIYIQHKKSNSFMTVSYTHLDVYKRQRFR